MSEHAIRPILTEARQVIRARNFFHVAMPTLGPMSTKSSCIIWALVALLFGIDMTVRTFSVGTFPVFRKEEAFRHASIIDGMEVVAQVLFFA